MLRRTFFMATAALSAVTARLRGQSRGELQRMVDEQLQDTPHKSAAIMEMGTGQLVEILQDQAADEFAKAKACQRLATVGDESAVPALSALLGHDQLSHYARTALEPMPGSAADRALRDALERLQGSHLVGVIHSVGSRRDPMALEALASLRHTGDSDVAAAATWAINRIRRP